MYPSWVTTIFIDIINKNDNNSTVRWNKVVSKLHNDESQFVQSWGIVHEVNEMAVIYTNFRLTLTIKKVQRWHLGLYISKNYKTIFRSPICLIVYIISPVPLQNRSNDLLKKL